MPGTERWVQAPPAVQAFYTIQQKENGRPGW